MSVSPAARRPAPSTSYSNDAIVITLDHTPGIAPVTGIEIVQWWTPTIGPSATLIAQILARAKDRTVITSDELGKHLGIDGRRAFRSLQRLDHYGLGQLNRHEKTFMLRTQLQPLDPYHRAKLSPETQRNYNNKLTNH